jgi:hypothetical protein
MHIQDTVVVSNVRHYEALNGALQSVEAVLEGLSKGISSDLVTVDLRMALYHLGQITGEITMDDILGNIFGRFCIEECQIKKFVITPKRTFKEATVVTCVLIRSSLRTQP